MAERDFDAERKPGHTFTLAGRMFRTYPSLPLNESRQEHLVDEEDTFKTTLNFIRSLIVVEDREEWDGMLGDPTVVLLTDDILSVSTWLNDQLRMSMAAIRENNGASAAPADEPVEAAQS